jgi:hydroxymethylbilane synthase
MAVQLRAGDEATRRWVVPLDHVPTRRATTAERALLARLEGGCQIPVGALAEPDGERLRLRAEVCALDGRATVAGEASGDPERARALGTALAEELLERGAGEILERIRRGTEAAP